MVFKRIVTAMILSDLILGKENIWSSLFDPSRSKPVFESSKEFIETNISVAKLLPAVFNDLNQ